MHYLPSLEHDCLLMRESHLDIFCVMTLLMTHSTFRSGLTLPPIHLVPYSCWHKSTFVLQHLGVRVQLWVDNLLPQWLILGQMKIMWVGVKSLLQTITWVNIHHCIDTFPDTNYNYMWTKDLIDFPFATCACIIL